MGCSRAAVLCLIGLGACTPQPKWIDFVDEIPTLHNTQLRPLPAIVVRDAKLRPVEPLPEMEFHAKPPGVVIVDRKGISALKNGRATVTVTVKGTDISTRATVEVILIESLRLTATPAKDDWEYPVAEDIKIVVSAMTNSGVLRDVEPVWESDNHGVIELVDATTLRAVGPGTTKIRARAMGLVAEREISVVARADELSVVCPPKTESVVPKGSELAAICRVSVGSAIKLATKARRRGVPVEGAKIEWSLSNNEAASISQKGWVLGLAEGRVIVRLESGDANAKVEIWVEPATKRMGGPASDFVCTGRFSVKVKRKPMRLHQPVYFGSEKKAGDDQAPPGIVDGWCEAEEGRRCIESWIARAGRYEAKALRDFASSCCCSLDLVGAGYERHEKRPSFDTGYSPTHRRGTRKPPTIRRRQ